MQPACNSRVIGLVTSDAMRNTIKIELEEDVHSLNAHLLGNLFPNEKKDLVCFIAKVVCKHELKIFDLFMTWVEDDVLPNLYPGDDERAKSVLPVYVKLYAFASDMHFNNLNNEIMDKLRDRCSWPGDHFPIYLVKLVYKSTPPNSPLRHYLVDTFIFRTKKWTALRRVQLLRDHDATNCPHNRQFVQDCDERKTMNMRRRLMGGDPNDKPRKDYYIGERQ